MRRGIGQPVTRKKDPRFSDRAGPAMSRTSICHARHTRSSSFLYMRTRGSTQWTKPCEALLTDLRCPSFKTGHCLTKPPAFRLFQRGRWQAERQNDILE